MKYGTPTTIPANQPKPVMTLIRSDTQQLMKAFAPANPIIPANIRPTCQPTQATSKRDTFSFVANVADVAHVALVKDVAASSDRKAHAPILFNDIVCC